MDSARSKIGSKRASSEIVIGTLDVFCCVCAAELLTVFAGKESSQFDQSEPQDLGAQSLGTSNLPLTADTAPRYMDHGFKNE